MTPAIPRRAPTTAEDDPAGRSLRIVGRLPVLDGWRALSILSVMSAHMLPMGPWSWNIARSIGNLGMVVFFNLSGFLIFSILLRDSDIRQFAIRRVARIVPLAWTVLAIIFIVTRPGWSTVLANFLFYANLPPFWLENTGVFWSLGVEMQFYALIAVLVALFGRSGLYVAVLAAPFVTGLRAGTGSTVSIVTWLRIDEILAGGMLAIALHHYGRERLGALLRKVPLAGLVLLFPLTVIDRLTWLCYLRPYASALLIGVTLTRGHEGVDRFLSNRIFRYVSKISYALYLIHSYTRLGWFGEGANVVRAAKRCLSFALTFAGAHLSTFYFEQPINAWAHRVSRPQGRPIEL